MNRNNRMRRLILATVLALACSFLPSAVLHAQARELGFERSAGSIPVTVVLAEGNGPPVIFRRATEPRNVIMINRSTSEAQLSSAVFSLLVVEARDPSGRDRADNAALRVNMPRSTPAYAQAGEAISRILRGPVRQVEGLGGEVRAIEVWARPLSGRAQ